MVNFVNRSENRSTFDLDLLRNKFSWFLLAFKFNIRQKKKMYRTSSFYGQVSKIMVRFYTLIREVIYQPPNNIESEFGTDFSDAMIDSLWTIFELLLV